jgi:DNA-binding transcriptional LysR family regulator
MAARSSTRIQNKHGLEEVACLAITKGSVSSDESNILNRIRVLLAVQPQVLCDLLAGLIQREPDIEVVGCVADPVDMLVAVRQSEADVVVTVSDDGELSGWHTLLFGEYPGLLVVTISADARCARVFRQEICSTPVSADTAQDLLSSIRQAFGA